MVTQIIPMSFYGVDTVICAINAAIALLIAYKAHRLYTLSRMKQHFYLETAFTVVGVALVTLTFTTAITYYNIFFVQGGIYFFDPYFNIDDLGFWLYYLGSLAAYGLLVLMYVPDRKHFALPALVFSVFSARYFEYFNVILFFMMAYIAFRASTNFFEKRSRPAFMVMSAFLMLAAYHAMMPLAAISKVAYVVAHGAHMAGYGSLLLMLLSAGKEKEI